MEPALALSVPMHDVAKYVNDPRFAGEQKADGHRLLMSHEERIGRNGARYTKAVPRGIFVPAGPWMLDGELVDGIYWVFDVIVGHPATGATLLERRQLLEKFVDVIGNPLIRLMPQAVTAKEKRDLMVRTAREGMEGLVFKRLDSPYRSGRTGDWVKVKYVMTADVIVSSLRDDGKESAGLSIIRDGKPLEIGRCSLVGRPVLEVGDVIEVKYLYIVDPSAPRLVQPVMLRKRTDKDPMECDGNELRVTNRTILT